MTDRQTVVAMSTGGDHWEVLLRARLDDVRAKRPSPATRQPGAHRRPARV